MHQVVTTPVDDWAHRVSVGGPSTKSKHRLALGHVKGRLASTLLYSDGSHCVDVMEQGAVPDGRQVFMELDQVLRGGTGDRRRWCDGRGLVSATRS